MPLRHDVRPGDIGDIVRRHRTIYAGEGGFGPAFEAYVAGPLAAFVLRLGRRDRLWVAEQNARIAGSIAIVRALSTDASAAGSWSIWRRADADWAGRC